jgi:Cu-Zn family superoxide dismutase
MKNIAWCGIVAAVALSVTAPAKAETAAADMRNPKGASVGKVVLTDTPTGVLLTVVLKDIPPGVHGFHVHEVGKCDGPAFTSAGAHFNPANHKHGFMSPDGAHAGDMPSLHADSSSAVQVEILVPNVTLQKGKPNSLMGPNGTTLVVHQAADDYKTDPSGNSGDRIVCGVISQ